MSKIKIKILDNGKGLYKLEKATTGSAGFDLVAAINNELIINPNSSILVPCGFSLALPKNFEAQVRPRSGLAHKNGIMIVNSPGTVDFAYRNEVKIILYNSGDRVFTIFPGDRIAQACFRPVPQVSFEYVDAIEQTVILSNAHPWVQEEKVKKRGLAKRPKRETVSLNEDDTEELIINRGGFGSSGTK